VNRRFWLVIPAAGSARRMGAAVPKQYLPLAGRTVIEWALAPFLRREDCEGIVVVLASEDTRWAQLDLARHPKVSSAIGGAERMDSVRAGVQAIADLAGDAAAESPTGDDAWVLVHDAARPCLLDADLDRLLVELSDDEVGGLLAVPVVDTLKRADDADRVSQTVPRAALWRALTPQMFRRAVLLRALDNAAAQAIAVTDEAQAVEALGLRPRLIAGDADNIKVTVAGDLERAERILRSRGGT
jgi:2-C-methyl-D-erythritol 4-phosphate cytidylyltransferase